VEAVVQDEEQKDAPAEAEKPVAEESVETDAVTDTPAEKPKREKKERKPREDKKSARPMYKPKEKQAEELSSGPAETVTAQVAETVAVVEEVA